MNVQLKGKDTVLDLSDTDALSAYIREHIQVLAVHTAVCQDSAGVCISIVAPPFIQFFDSIHNRVDVVMDIERQSKPGIRKTSI